MTRDGTIDYSKYTRAELLDALEHIDKDRYPLSRANLQRELATRYPSDISASQTMVGAVREAPATASDYVNLVFGLLVPALLLGAALWWPDVKASDLKLVSGQLTQYTLQKGRRSGYVCIFSLAGRHGRYWTREVDESTAPKLFERRPVELQFYIDPANPFRPKDGNAVKTYGLWVNGQVIRTLADALARESAIVHVLFPILAFVFIVLAGVRHARRRRSNPIRRPSRDF